MVSEGAAVGLTVVFVVLIVYVWQSEKYDPTWRWMLIFGFLMHVFSFLADVEGGETPITLLIALIFAVPAVILAMYILGSETFTLEDSEDDKPP